jgi:hypothetical protein
MFRYHLIDKKSIISPTARRVYRAAAVLQLLLFFGWVAIGIYGVPPTIAPWMRQLLFFFALCMATAQIGMEVFLFRFDNSHPLKQVFWFCVLLVPFFGVALYCFIVYSHSEAVRNQEKPKDILV